MIKNDNTIYSITQLIEEAKKGFFPFRSRITIRRMSLKGLMPAHFAKIGKKYKRWYYVGRELLEWFPKTKTKVESKKIKTKS
jgi:hypothetical protein